MMIPERLGEFRRGLTTLVRTGLIDSVLQMENMTLVEHASKYPDYFRCAEYAFKGILPCPVPDEFWNNTAKYLREYKYLIRKELMVGCIVGYRHSKNGLFEHFGFLGRGGKMTSKWGEGPVITAPMFTAPHTWGDEIVGIYPARISLLGYPLF